MAINANIDNGIDKLYNVIPHVKIYSPKAPMKLLFR